MPNFLGSRWQAQTEGSFTQLKDNWSHALIKCVSLTALVFAGLLDNVYSIIPRTSNRQSPFDFFGIVQSSP